MLYRFFGNVGKQPDQVTSPEVFGYAHGIGPSGKKPSSCHHYARIACHEFILPLPHPHEPGECQPCDQLERPRATPAPPRGLTAADIKKLLDFIPGYPSWTQGSGHHFDLDPHRAGGALKCSTSRPAT